MWENRVVIPPEVHGAMSEDELRTVLVEPRASNDWLVSAVDQAKGLVVDAFAETGIPPDRDSAGRMPPLNESGGHDRTVSGQPKTEKGMGAAPKLPSPISPRSSGEARKGGSLSSSRCLRFVKSACGWLRRLLT